jgi:hypothetical protein
MSLVLPPSSNGWAIPLIIKNKKNFCFEFSPYLNVVGSFIAVEIVVFLARNFTTDCLQQDSY